METDPEGLITCLFTDIEGSTQLSKGLHPEDWKRIASEHDDILTRCITEHSGKPERTEGDSFFATFHTATAALKCAVALQEALHDNGKALLTVPKNGADLPLKVRIGVYQVTREVYRTGQGAYRDHQVSLAQRTMDCGVGEMIVVNGEAYRAAHDYLSLPWRAWNNRLVKDIPAPQTLYELLWDGDSTHKIRAPLWIPVWFRRSEDSFVGRDAYLAEIDRELKTGHRLTLLHGEGGIGKTRLALQVARQMDSHFSGRICGVPFDGLTEKDLEKVTPGQVALEIARALSSPDDLFNGIDPEGYAQRLVEHLNRRFFDQPFLLILDNFENANNPSTRKLLGDLLRDVASLRCLVTCRMHFSLAPYSFALEIGGLHYPRSADANLDDFEAYRLFRDRALACYPPPDLSDRRSVVSILTDTGGSALGIELIAARVGMPLMSLQKIADGLKESYLKWQSTDPNDTRAGSPRHESIEACIDWSYQLLPPEEQTLYSRLGIFPVDFSLKAAQEICGITETHLAHWIRSHLLSEVGDRFLLSPVLREFAMRRLPVSEIPDLNVHFAIYILTIAKHNEDMNQPEERNSLRTELLNLHIVADLLCANHINSDNANQLIILGKALWRIPAGVRAENLQKAIAYYEAALRVRTPQAFPVEWAMTRNNLGSAYSKLPPGDISQNLQKAIAYYKEALTILTKEDFPQCWSIVQPNLKRAERVWNWHYAPQWHTWWKFW